MTTAAIVGSFGPAQIACIHSWRVLGIRTIFIHLNDISHDVPLIHGLIDIYFNLSSSDFMHQECRTKLIEILRQESVQGITALSYALIAQLHVLSRDATWPSGLTVWATPADSLAFLNSKIEQANLAKACGLNVALTWYANNTERLNEVPTSFYPIVIRPNGDGTALPSFKMKYIASVDQMSGFLDSLKVLRGSLIVQPYLEGKNIIVHGVRSPITGQIVHAAFSVNDMLDGVTLSLQPCDISMQILESCSMFAKLANLEGAYHFEFRYSIHDGLLYFLEVNGRLGGTTNKVLRLGFDEPALLVSAFLGNPLQVAHVAHNVVVSNRQAIVKAILRTLSGRLTIFDYPQQTNLRRIYRLLVGFCRWHDEIYHWKCWRLALAYFLHQIISK